MTARAHQLGVVAAAMSADPREAAAASRASGFAGLAFDAFSPAFDLTQLSQSGQREFSRLLRSSDQSLIALRADLGPKGFLPGADVDRLLSQLLKVMEAAKGLGAPLVGLEVGPLPEPPPESIAAPRVTAEQAGVIIIPDMNAAKPQAAPAGSQPDPTIAAHVDGALRELCAYADRVGVTLALRSELASFAALDRALNAAACPSLGVDLDPVAILRDTWPADEIFSRLGPLVRHVVGRDATAGADKRTRPAVIGRGSTDWATLLSDLDAAGYRGWITIDPLELPDRRAAARAGADFLRKP